MSAWYTKPFDKQNWNHYWFLPVVAFVPVELSLSKSFTPLHQKKCSFILTDKGSVVYFESRLLIQILSKAPNVLSFAANSPQQMDYCIYAAANQLFYEIAQPIFKTKHGIPYFLRSFSRFKGDLGDSVAQTAWQGRREMLQTNIIRIIPNKNTRDYRGTIFILLVLFPSMLTPVYHYNFLSCAETLHDMYLSLPKRKGDRSQFSGQVGQRTKCV